MNTFDEKNLKRTEREVKTIKLSNCEVDIVTFLTWGEKEEIEKVIIQGANVTETGLQKFDTSVLLESKYKTLEICVVEIREKGQKKQFTKEWMNNLSAEDGDKLYDAVNKVTGKKK